MGKWLGKGFHQWSMKFQCVLQSAEEIERLTVDENLDDIERAVLLMRLVFSHV